MDIQVGDRITYKFIDKDGIFTEIVGSNNLSLTSIHWFKEHLEDKEIEIIKIERPKYEVVEEKKELLTEEEKAFLKIFIKIKKDEILAIKRNENDLEITGKEWDNSILTDEFKGLEMHKLYTLKELGLEEV